MTRRHFLKATSKYCSGLSILPILPDIVWGWAGSSFKLIRRHRLLMGTTFMIVIPDDSFSMDTVQSGFRVLSEIDRSLSVFKPESDVMRVNTTPGKWHLSSKYLVEVTKAAKKLSLITDGVFDVTILPLMRQCGFYEEINELQSIEMLSDRIDIKKLEVRGDYIRVSESGFAVDYGGIGKGYGVDQAISAIQASGCRNALIAASGDIYALGRPAPYRRWKIGIQSPYRNDSIIGTLELENEAVSTSGGYENRRITRKRSVSHILHPKLGPSVESILSATVVAPDVTTADALSTATYIMGIDNAQGLINALPGVEGIWFDRHGEIFTTPDIRKRLQVA